MHTNIARSRIPVLIVFLLMGLIGLVVSFTGADEQEYTSIIQAPDTVSGDWFATALDQFEGTLVVTAFKATGDKAWCKVPTKNRSLGRIIRHYFNACLRNVIKDGSGAAYIFKKNTDGWFVLQRLAPPGGRKDDQFGFSVSIYESSIAVGAPLRETAIEYVYKAGAVYLYKQNTAGNWIFDQLVESPQPQRGDNFGFTVSLGDSVLAVGAKLDDQVSTNSGAVYLFRRVIPTGNWELFQTLLPEKVVLQGRFGSHVRISGQWLFVGETGSVANGIRSGAVHVYKFDVYGKAQFHQQLKSPTESQAHGYGENLDVVGDYAVVGASSWGAQNRTGAAYIYELQSDNWTLINNLDPRDLATGDSFGFRVEIFNNTVAVGAHHHDARGIDAGAVYVFNKKPETANWEFSKKYVATDGNVGDSFGIAISLGELGLIVGAERAQSDAGGFYEPNLSPQ